MKDAQGVYYYPFPQNKRVRMYVSEEGGDICFRLWNQDDPELWMEHGWLPYEAIKKAAGMYDKKKFDPDHAYDIDAARELLKADKTQ